MHTHSSQSGIALITVLLIVALATATAVAMTTRQHIDLRRAENSLHADQGYLFALGGESLAIGILNRDLKDRPEADDLNEDWAQVLPPMAIEGRLATGQIEGRIEDAQARFNLNNLHLPENADAATIQRVQEQMTYFDELLRAAGVQTQLRLGQQIQDWVDANIQVQFPDGAEDNEYLNREVAYRAGNALMSHASELRLLKDVDAGAYRALMPLVTALPEPTKINVNSAPPAVLQALAPKHIDAGVAKALIEQRAETPFGTLNDFADTINRLAGNQQPLQAADLEALAGVTSNYFLLRARTTLGRTQLQLNSLISRQGGKSHTIARSLGAY